MNAKSVDLGQTKSKKWKQESHYIGCQSRPLASHNPGVQSPSAMGLQPKLPKNGFWVGGRPLAPVSVYAGHICHSWEGFLLHFWESFLLRALSMDWWLFWRVLWRGSCCLSLAAHDMESMTKWVSEIKLHSRKKGFFSEFMSKILSCLTSPWNTCGLSRLSFYGKKVEMVDKRKGWHKGSRWLAY